MFLILYPVLRSLEAKGGSRGVLEMFPNVGKSPEGGSVCPLRSQNWREFWQTEYAQSMENMFLILYPVVRSLEAKGGPWGAEMQWKFPPMWEYRPRGTYLYTKESVLGLSLANGVYRIHGEHVLDVLSSAGVAGCKGWSVGC